MKHYIFNLILFFLVGGCLNFPVNGQPYEYAPNEILIKWKSNKETEQRSRISSISVEFNKRTEYKSLDIEFWELAETQDIMAVIRKYKDHPAIEFIEPNYIYKSFEIIPIDPMFGDQWALNNTGQAGGTANADIKAPLAWEIQKESPTVKVAIIDSGVDWKHPELIDNIWQNLAEDTDGDGHVLEWDGYRWVFDSGDIDGIDNDNNGYIDDFIGWDFRNNDNNPFDETGHGTHIAGIIGAKGNNGIGVAGVTWEVQLAALKIIEGGQLKISDAVAAIDYAIAMGIPISNNSWGGNVYSEALFDAIQNATTQDHLFIAASGNDAIDTDISLIFPASYPLDNIISVAASTPFDTSASFTNYGATTVDLFAPGSSILSCLPNSTYGTRSGTSQAAPFVTGACALLKEIFPNHSNLEIKDVILNSVDLLPSLQGKSLTGGRLNLFNLLSQSGVNCSYRDSLSLVAFYHATNGPNWTISWNLSEPISTWHGITTNNMGCVTAINLSNNNLTGAIPTTIRSLYNLESLNLSNNQLNGNIPTTIGKLENLVHLELSHNQLSNAIPPEIGSLSSLQYLHLNHNQLSGALPTTIGKLEDLVHLQLNDNQLSGNIPEIFRSLNDLKRLYLNDNQLSGSLPYSLSGSYVLEWLYLNNNQLSGSIIYITNLYSIKKLYLNNNQFQGSIPAEISNFYSIEELNLSDNQLSGSIPAALGGLVNLQQLHLENNQLSGCFSQNFTSLCSIDYNFSGNSTLSEGGNFSNFCTNGSGACLSCAIADSLALVALYNATNGANWTTTWNLSTPINTWFGIKTNNDGCVITIDLSRNNLAGIIPLEIGNLDQLDNLDLSSNQLIGSIPIEIGNLSNLEKLSLTNNQLTEPIPVTVGNLSNLIFLNIHTNNLIGSIPTEIGNLINLDYLGIGSNKLTGTIPSSVGNLTNLRILDLASNQLSGTIPTTFGNLITLTSLNLSINQLSGIIPSQLGSLKNLTSLNLYHNQLEGNIPLEIFNLKKLGSLSLSTNQLTGLIPNEIGALKNLYYLFLGTNQLTGAIPAGIGQLSNLKTLYLNNNQLTGTLPEWIVNLTSVEKLNIADNQLTGVIPPTLGNLNNLQTLHLNDNQLEGCFPKNLLNLCAVSNIDFSGNSSLSDEGDFDSFCTSEAGICTDPVWPGDFNNDGIANNADVLYWGLACADTPGPTRPNASTEWVGQEAPNWATATKEVNSKHQDGDGNGVINEADLQVLINNYGKIHGYQPFNNLTNGFNYNLTSLNIGGDTLKIALSIESDGAPINLHGMACSIDFGSLPIDTFNFDLTNSSLNASHHLITFNSIESTLDIALTRTDKTDIVSDGQMGILWVVVADLLEFGDDILINVKRGNQMQANGAFNSIGSASLYSTYSLPPSTSNLLIDVSVSPVECDKLGTAKVNISGGVEPYEIVWSNGAINPTITGLTEGTYVVTVTDANNLEAIYEAEVEGLYIPEYNQDGILIDCSTTACPSNLNLLTVVSEGLHQASNSITTNGLLSSGKTASLKAGTSINFQPGFSVAAGGHLLATIENCSTTIENNNINSNSFKPIIISSDKVIERQLISTSSIKKPDISIRPNPFKDQTMIFYELPNPSWITISIYSLDGTLILQLEEEIFKEAGAYAVKYLPEKLAEGIHFVQLQTEQGGVTKKMIVME